MRIWQKVLISIGSVVGLLLSITGGLLAYASADKQDTFYLRDAELSDPHYLDALAVSDGQSHASSSERLPVYAHRLKRGKGSVFGFRFYSGGDFFVIDDESYRKVTIWTASPPPSSRIEFDLGDESLARVIFTEGGSAWPENVCSGYVSSGRITIDPVGGLYLVTVHGVLQRAGGRRSNQCDQQKIDMNFKTKEIAYERLTPWLGIAGANPYRETYRPLWR